MERVNSTHDSPVCESEVCIPFSGTKIKMNGDEVLCDIDSFCSEYRSLGWGC